MPKKVAEKSALEVKRLKHHGGRGNAVHAVGGVDGLVLQISDRGARSWVLRTMVGGKRRHIGLGGFPDVTLATARERAREMKDLIWRGIDPVEDRKAKRATMLADRMRGLTFSDAMERYLEKKLQEFDNPKHRKQWRSTLDNYAVPVLGNLRVAEIGLQDMQRTLEPIWSDKTETASRLRGRIEAVLNWATVAGYRQGDNPARWAGNLDAVLPKPSKLKKQTHHPALSLADAPDWFAEVRRRDGFGTRALEFLALTACRSGEVRGATWSEMDLDARLWTIPAGRMKAGKEHRVPLTNHTIDLLSAMPRMDGVELVFPSARGGQLSDMTLSRGMKRIHEAKEGGFVDAVSQRPAVPHGLRSTFRDWAAESGYPRDMAEIALAHTVGSEVERAYRRSDMLERRRIMMAAWQNFLLGKESKTVLSLEAG